MSRVPDRATPQRRSSSQEPKHSANGRSRRRRQECAVVTAALLTACARFGYENLPLGAIAAAGSRGGLGDAGGTLLEGAGGGAAGTATASGGAAGTATASGGAAGTATASGGAAGSAVELSDAGDSAFDAGPPLPEASGFAPSCSDGVQNQGEAAVDCGGATCQPCPCSFGAPVVLGNPNIAGSSVYSPALTADGLLLFVAAIISGAPEQVMVSARLNVGDPFGPAISLPPPINISEEGTPFVLADGLTLYFYSSRPGFAGSRDLFRATRASRGDDFGNVTALSSINSNGIDHIPWVSADELTIYYSSTRPGSLGTDLYRASRASSADPFDPPTPLSELNTSSQDDGMTLTPDQRVAIFTSDRPGGAGLRDLYWTERASINDAFSAPQRLSELSTSAEEHDPELTPDGTELYFVSRRGASGNAEIWHASRTCP